MIVPVQKKGKVVSTYKIYQYVSIDFELFPEEHCKKAPTDLQGIVCPEKIRYNSA